MFHRATIASLLIAATSFLPPTRAAADDEGTTVALTAAVYAEAGQPERELIDALLALLESEVSMQPGLAVVERRQIDLALQELALSEDLGRNAATRLQLGNIVSADLILALELKKPEPEDQTLRVLIRIVESLTGIVRGVSVTPVGEAELDAAASQIARYLAMTEAAPDKPPITVAVAPFESQGRFDRLRPLELGLRDMIAARLLRWSDTIAKETAGATEQARKENGQADKPAGGFQVLQRSSMRELLRELEMIQSGLVDHNRLPTNLPTRAAAFLVRGKINENNDGGEYRVVVTGELVQAASNITVRDFKFAAKPGELEVALAHQVDLLAGRLLNSKDEVSPIPGPLREVSEVNSLLNGATADLRRFRRVRPIDFSYREFELPVGGVTVGTPIVQADTPLGRAILKKSIDRLEATLFIQPDRGDAAYALGFCYAFHIDGIWNADRADELLRRAAGSDPDGPLGAAAIRLLGEISFHHTTGQVAKGHEQRAVDQLLYTFQNTPRQHRDKIWARLPVTMSPLLSRLRDATKTMQVIEFAAAEGEREDSPFRYELAMGVSALSAGLTAWRDPAAGADPVPLLERWATGEQVTLKQVAARGLAQMAKNQRDYAAAAKWYLLAGADALASSISDDDLIARENLRVHAARCLRQAGQWREALELLESFQPNWPTSLNAGYYAVELGQCYMEASDRDKALDVLVTAAERVPGLRDNSNVEQLINRLGPVPLREDRDVDVTYVAGPDGKPLVSRVLTTDGSTLFCAGGFLGGVPRGVLALDARRQTWQPLTTAFGRVTSIAVHDRQLWVGTAEEGVWRCALSSNRWMHWSGNDGLPDDRVTVLTANASGVFVGVGTASGGGVVHLDPDGKVTVLDGQDAPSAAPSSLVVQGDRLLATTLSAVHEFDLGSKKWISTVKEGGLSVFPGQSHAWVSHTSRKLAPYGADDEAAQRFSSAWYKGGDKSGYRVLFAIEHKDQIWFGGEPWARFRSVGFYRFDPRTGEFRMYDLRDGFQMSTTYETYSGVAIGNDLWLATSAGLARVTPRQ